jgi:hypothetical protein
MLFTLSLDPEVIWRIHYYAGSARIVIHQVDAKMLTDYQFTGQLV